MDSEELLATIKEVMQKYDELRRQWIEMNGSAAGFDEWFTEQIQTPAIERPEFPHGEFPSRAEVSTMTEPPSVWPDDSEPDYNPN